ncbi:EF-hand domain-containing protein [Actinomycetes bacterium KLBMP 9759]
MTTATVLDRKLDRTYDMFLAMIPNSSGLREEHFEATAQRLAQGNPDTTREQLSRLVAANHAFWDEYLKPMDANGDGVIDRNEFRTGFDKALERDRDGFIGAFSNSIMAWMDIIDTDRSNTVERDEFVSMYQRTFGAPVEKLNEAFDKLDLNGDGSLDTEELKQAVLEYWTSDDPSAPGNWLFGSID